MWPFRRRRGQAPPSSEGAPPAKREIEPGVIPDDVAAMLGAQAFLGAYDRKADKSLKAALARVDAISWEYEPLPDEAKIREEIWRRVESREAAMYYLAGALLRPAHTVVFVVDQRAMPVWRPTWQWDAVCEAAFCTLVYGRLRLTGVLPAVQAAYAAKDTEDGLEMPAWPLVGHPEAAKEARALIHAAGAAANAVDDPAPAWTAMVRPYARLLCYAQHAENFQDDVQERVDRLERKLERLDDHSERNTFGQGSF